MTVIDETQAIIQRIEEQLRIATLENDVSTSEALIAPDWLNINAAGTVTSKAQTLAIMPNFRFLSIINTDVKIRVYPNVAVVTGASRRELELSPDETKVSEVLFTRVYAHVDGQWRLVTSQATPRA